MFERKGLPGSPIEHAYAHFINYSYHVPIFTYLLIYHSGAHTVCTPTIYQYEHLISALELIKAASGMLRLKLHLN